VVPALIFGQALSERVFASRDIGAAQYGMALASLCRSHRLDGVRGEGTFSDVYAVNPAAATAATPASTAVPALAHEGARGWIPDDDDASTCGGDRAMETTQTVGTGGAGGGTAAGCAAVLKCSVPFPGVIQGRAVGDGLGIGEVEARVLAHMPRHPRVVRLLAAFLSVERNESYLLLADAGANLHAMRERGEVTTHLRPACRA
jgi:hypothetical protein